MLVNFFSYIYKNDFMFPRVNFIRIKYIILPLILLILNIFEHNYIKIKYIAPKLQVNLRVTTDSVVQRDHPLGTTVVPKVANVIDHGTHTSEVVPYNEMRSMQATSTVVSINFNFILIKKRKTKLFKNLYLKLILVGKNS